MHQKTQGFEYDAVIASLRTKIGSLPRNSQFESEGKWLSDKILLQMHKSNLRYASMIDTWNKLKGLPSLSEDGCTIKKNIFINNANYAEAAQIDKDLDGIKRENKIIQAEIIGPPQMGRPSNYGYKSRRYIHGNSRSREWRNKKNAHKNTTKE